MSEHTISLAFSVWHHYLKQFTEKHQISLPIFPEQLKKVDISYFLRKQKKLFWVSCQKFIKVVRHCPVPKGI